MRQFCNAIYIISEERFFNAIYVKRFVSLRKLHYILVSVLKYINENLNNKILEANNPTNQENWPSVGTIASTLAQYGAIYGNTLRQFSWFVGYFLL